MSFAVPILKCALGICLLLSISPVVGTVTVESIQACCGASPDRHVRVLLPGATDPAGAVQVEEFVAQRLRDDGRKVMFCESRPFQVLYGSLMWLWMCMFGGRDAVGADERGLIWTQLPHDFGSFGHARRRGQALQEHLDLIPNDLPGMLWTYGYWQGDLLARRWDPGESFVYESGHGRSRPPGQGSRR
jgi:hypothetical protein